MQNLCGGIENPFLCTARMAKARVAIRHPSVDQSVACGRPATSRLWAKNLERDLADLLWCEGRSLELPTPSLHVLEHIPDSHSNFIQANSEHFPARAFVHDRYETSNYQVKK